MHNPDWDRVKEEEENPRPDMRKEIEKRVADMDREGRSEKPNNPKVQNGLCKDEKEEGTAGMERNGMNGTGRDEDTQNQNWKAPAVEVVGSRTGTDYNFPCRSQENLVTSSSFFFQETQNRKTTTTSINYGKYKKGNELLQIRVWKKVFVGAFVKK